MNFKVIRVWYSYPADPAPRHYSKDYSVPDNEPFPGNHAFKQWQQDHSLPHALIAFHSYVEIRESPAPIIQLPIGFCETKYPGYFWNANEKKLYSIKSGVLKEIPRRNWNGYGWRSSADGYRVSHLGMRRFLSHEQMMMLVPVRAIIPTQPVPKRPGSRWR